MNLAELRRRIEDRVAMIPFAGCWLWLGYTEKNGYARMSFGGLRGKWVHRLSFLAFNGPIPQGLDVLHACDVPCCVNPRHLSVGTPSANAKQMIERGRHPLSLEARKTHCKRGHPLSGDNLGINATTKTRYCKTCSRESRRAS